MSIAASLSNALSGLTAASRAAQLVSSNVANSMTEGYARRELDLSARSACAGGGVQIDGINRVVDETILRDRRLADASLGQAKAEADFHSDLLGLLGEPNDPSSLTARVANLESALIEASSRPDSDVRLSAVLDTAQDLVSGLNNASDGIQRLRQDADASIASEVTRLNNTLEQISDVTALIQRSKASGQDFPGLLDQRQSLIDEIASIVPIRQITRQNDGVALYTANGALLLDIEPAKFAFSTTSPITADMTQESGALSQLTLNGQPVRTTGENGPIAGGRLAGLFAVRDELSVSAQGGLDALSADLVARFENPAIDATRAVDDPGLFTDNGALYDASTIIGLSSRLSVNSLVKPAEGGGLWRLRDGLGASAPGPVGDAALLAQLSDALAEFRTPVAGGYGGAARDFSSLAAALTSRVGESMVTGEREIAFSQTRRDTLRDSELSNGVDTDQEMQKLLLIEQAYAANARVIQTVDRLIQNLLEI